MTHHEPYFSVIMSLCLELSRRRLRRIAGIQTTLVFHVDPRLILRIRMQDRTGRRGCWSGFWSAAERCEETSNSSSAVVIPVYSAAASARQPTLAAFTHRPTEGHQIVIAGHQNTRRQCSTIVVYPQLHTYDQSSRPTSQRDGSLSLTPWLQPPHDYHRATIRLP